MGLDLGRIFRGRSNKIAQVRGATVPSADYRAAIDRYIAKEEADVQKAGLTRRPDAKSFRLFHEGARRPVVVFFHGYSAGTRQFENLARRAFDEGYDVFAPALPGHGLLDAQGKEDTRGVPEAPQWKAWETFADSIYDLVKGAGDVRLVGLSCGGMLSLGVAERHADDRNPKGDRVIRNVLAYSPYLGLAGEYVKKGPLQLSNRAVERGMDRLETVAGRPVDFVLDRIREEMQKDPRPMNFGFHYGTADQIVAMDRAASDTKAHAKDVRGKVPVQIVATADDARADPSQMRAFADKAGASFYLFPKDEHVPHAMVHPLENPVGASFSVVNGFLDQALSGG